MLTDLTSLIRPENIWLLAILAIWSLIWKGLALWYASGRRQKAWFIILLVLNTVGILEIIYLFFVVKVQDKSSEIAHE